jgi:hypothetical protein
VSTLFLIPAKTKNLFDYSLSILCIALVCACNEEGPATVTSDANNATKIVSAVADARKRESRAGRWNWQELDMN